MLWKPDNIKHSDKRINTQSVPWNTNSREVIRSENTMEFLRNWKTMFAVMDFVLRHFHKCTITITYLLTSRSSALLKKANGFQLVNKFPAFYGTQRFIPHSQVIATCPYPVSDQSSPYPHIPLP